MAAVGVECMVLVALGLLEWVMKLALVYAFFEEEILIISYSREP